MQSSGRFRKEVCRQLNNCNLLMQVSSRAGPLSEGAYLETTGQGRTFRRRTLGSGRTGCRCRSPTGAADALFIGMRKKLNKNYRRAIKKKRNQPDCLLMRINAAFISPKQPWKMILEPSRSHLDESGDRFDGWVSKEGFRSALSAAVAASLSAELV